MDKDLARKADVILKRMSNNSRVRAWTIGQIETVAVRSGISLSEAGAFIAMCIEDEIFERVKHPNMPDHDFGIYTLSNKGLKFIHIDGGYTEKQQVENYKRTNVRFTWIRHWVWFYTSIISLLANAYFILKYLSKWL